MPKFSLAKLLSTIFFIILLFFFFYWMIQQTIDLGYFFGLRLSDRVVTDIGGLATITADMPIGSYVIYEESGRVENGKSVIYTVEIRKNILCVTAYSTITTIDCVSIPLLDQDGKIVTQQSEFKLKISKEFEANLPKVKIKVV